MLPQDDKSRSKLFLFTVSGVEIYHIYYIYLFLYIYYNSTTYLNWCIPLFVLFGQTYSHGVILYHTGFQNILRFKNLYQSGSEDIRRYTNFLKFAYNPQLIHYKTHPSCGLDLFLDKSFLCRRDDPYYIYYIATPPQKKRGHTKILIQNKNPKIQKRPRTSKSPRCSSTSKFRLPGGSLSSHESDDETSEEVTASMGSMGSMGRKSPVSQVSSHESKSLRLSHDGF